MKNKSSLACIPGLIAVSAVWLGLSFLSAFKPADEYSDSERRKLAQFPEINAQSVFSGDFMSEFEDYTLDQFPLRDRFRSLKAFTAFNVFMKKDNNDIYVADGYAAKIEYPLDETSIENAAEKFGKYYEKYFAESDADIYLAVVPDKGYYLAEPNGYPSLDYDKLFSIMKEKMPYAEYIDLTDTLEVSDYYRTDTHWRQEKISEAAEKILSAMGAEAFDDLETVRTDVPFYGVYYGQSALPLDSESISYMTNSVLEGCTVTAFDSHTNKMETVEMYSKKHLGGKDPYEMFLYGATPVVAIENPNAEKQRELVIFRDSFGSSISPLLVKSYSKVTLLDTRYIHPDFMSGFIGENTDDVLFLYSTLILNSSETIR